MPSLSNTAEIMRKVAANLSSHLGSCTRYFFLMHLRSSADHSNILEDVRGEMLVTVVRKAGETSARS